VSCINRIAAVVLIAFISTNAWAQSSVIRYYQVPATTLHPALTVTVELISMLTPKPTVGVVLFAGGKGKINYINGVPAPVTNPDGSINNDSLANNFLVRKRNLFAQKGVMVAVVDIGPLGVTVDERLSAAHAQIVSQLLAKIRVDPGHEVSRLWLVGTSTGTLTAANVAARYPVQQAFYDPTAPGTPPPSGSPDGIVLTSTLTVRDAMCGNKSIDDVTMPSLTSANVPAYVIWNSTDQCACSPGTGPGTPGVAQTVVSKFGSSRIGGPKRVGYAFSGAGAAGDQCSGLAAHGFVNIEDSVVSYIVNSVWPH
jgi:hypothetical protein